MKTLVVEDEFTSRLLLQEILKEYGPVHIAINGQEAVDAVQTALENKAPYDLICLDIILPEMDGQTALEKIRTIEHDAGISDGDGARIIMTTALGDEDNIMGAFGRQTDAYIIKPISKGKLLAELINLELIEADPEESGVDA
jgi:two-component system chemotaxis response regulator CheY